MYLMDAIAEIAAETKAQKGSLVDKDPTLNVFGETVKLLHGAPRFLLDNETINAAVELTLGRPKILFESLAHLRVPYPVMWVEWEEAGRERLRQTFGGAVESAGRPLPQRLGFLIQAEEGGRRGQVTWMWSGPASLKEADRFPNPAPISAFFDLDAEIPQSENRIRSFLLGNLWRMWEDNPTQRDALLAIWRTADHRPSDWGAAFLAETMKRYGEASLIDRLKNCYADVYGEYIIIWAIMLLLTASRPAVAYRKVDRGRLNKARRKRRETPLMDHTEVVMHVARPPAGLARGPLGHERKSPRIHMVSRYLARRGDKHWIVEPYWRGQGQTIHRRTHVRR